MLSAAPPGVVSQPRSAHSSSTAPDFSGSHLLIVEDNAANRMLTLAMLKPCGASVDTAENGEEAVRAVVHRPYDMVLMDCQMPRMDGYEATQLIRRQEAAGLVPRAGDSGRLPIVALTASAMAGDREKCLAVGMDDYLGKPFTRRQLLRLLARHLTSPPVEAPQAREYGPRPAGTGEGTPVARSDGAPADRVSTLDRRSLEIIRELETDESPDLLERIIDAYLSTAPELLGQLGQATAAEDPEALAKAAHSLKSSSANLGAARLAEMCAQLERDGRARSMNTSPEVLTALEGELERVCTALATECHRAA